MRREREQGEGIEGTRERRGRMREGREEGENRKMEEGEKQQQGVRRRKRFLKGKEKAGDREKDEEELRRCVWGGASGWSRQEVAGKSGIRFGWNTGFT